MLYTCGLDNVGPSCTDDDGTIYPIHGRIGHTPAYDVSTTAKWSGDELCYTIEGIMRYGRLFGPNLTLKRNIRSYLGSNKIEISDTVSNDGFDIEEFMILYHFNFSYPIIDEGTILHLPLLETKARDEVAAIEIDTFNQFHAPLDDYPEQVFYHTMKADENGETYAIIENKNLGINVKLTWNIDVLPELIQWKSMKSGDYALGVEPANCLVSGRLGEREQGRIKTIAPGESINYKLSLEIL